MTLHDFLSKVDRILEIDGATVTDAFRRTRAGWEHLAGRHHERTDTAAAIAEAVATGEPAAIDAAVARALDSETVRTSYELLNRTGEATEAALRVEYRHTAAGNYDAVRRAWQDIADKLTAASRETDLNTPAERVVSASAKVRTAWETGPVLAHQLTGLTTVLTDAAVLAGARLHEPSLKTADWPFALTTDPGDLHRRTVWDAWDTTDHRAGRWGALLAAGAALTAPTLEAAKPYRRPRPMQSHHERAGIGWRQVWTDPEDTDSQPAATGPRVTVS